MLRRRFPVATALGGVLAACAIALTLLAPAGGQARTRIAPPVVHEHFTLLPCPRNPRTTLQIEGCAEHRVLSIDRTIDALNAKAFARLGTSGRLAFIRANTDWLGYRDAECTSEASIYAGGSVQPVAYANCLVSIDSTHVRDLHSALVALSPAG